MTAGMRRWIGMTAVPKVRRIWHYFSHRGMTNAVAVAVAKGAVMAVRTAFLLWVAYAAGPDTFGRLALCVSATEVLRMVCDFGTQTLFVRRLAQASSSAECRRQFIAMGRFRIVAAAIGVALYFLIVGAVFAWRLGVLDVLPVGLLVTSLATSYPMTFYQAKLKMEKAIGPIIVCAALYVGVSLEFAGKSIVGEMAGLIAYELVAAAALSRAVWAELRIDVGLMRHRRRQQSLRSIAVESLPIAGGLVIGTVYTRLDVFAVKVIAGGLALGLYSYAFRLTEPFRYLALAIESSLYSHLAGKLSESGARIPRFSLLAKFVVVYASLFSATGYIVGMLITRFMYPAFITAKSTILALSLALFFRCLNGYQSAVQNALGRYRLTAIFAVIGLVVTGALIYPMTNTYGFLGAALTLLFMEFVNCVVQGYFYRNTVRTLREGCV